MLIGTGNHHQQFQLSISSSSRKNHISGEAFRTDIQSKLYNSFATKKIPVQNKNEVLCKTTLKKSIVRHTP